MTAHATRAARAIRAPRVGKIGVGTGIARAPAVPMTVPVTKAAATAVRTAAPTQGAHVSCRTAVGRPDATHGARPGPGGHPRRTNSGGVSRVRPANGCSAAHVSALRRPGCPDGCRCGLRNGDGHRYGRYSGDPRTDPVPDHPRCAGSSSGPRSVGGHPYALWSDDPRNAGGPGGHRCGGRWSDPRSVPGRRYEREPSGPRSGRGRRYEQERSDPRSADDPGDPPRGRDRCGRRCGRCVRSPAGYRFVR